MRGINQYNLILEKEAFERARIEKRMTDGGFNSISKFELFIWDLEMFLQFQRKLGDKILLKGGAATQFYIPITAQRTSIDIDMICLATQEEVNKAISEIEGELSGEGEYCKFKAHKPKDPKLGLDTLKTYYEKVPSVCNEKELYTSRGQQEVKIEFLFSDQKYPINRVKQPELFALETENEFNVLALEYLFADKLTTLGPNTIGVSDERSDEQFKQIYDVITLLESNLEQILYNKENIKDNYKKAAELECQIHNIPYDPERLLTDMKLLINRVKNIESDSILMKRANDFQSLYLRSIVNRDRAQWAIVGYKLGLLAEYIFKDNTQILSFRKIEELIDKLSFEKIHGPERGSLINMVRGALEENFNVLVGLSTDIFRKRLDRVIWELASMVSFEVIEDFVKALLTEYRIQK